MTAVQVEVRVVGGEGEKKRRREQGREVESEGRKEGGVTDQTWSMAQISLAHTHLSIC